MRPHSYFMRSHDECVLQNNARNPCGVSDYTGKCTGSQVLPRLDYPEFKTCNMGLGIAKFGHVLTWEGQVSLDATWCVFGLGGPCTSMAGESWATSGHGLVR
ncbi:hypothetical protein PIB30_052419 [Stylosanthes scabra]|uniref:Uncharacterized protein n=1 Tax=Stylosanthes scabra TaxID=79078 RepID=A0ABU6SJT6_9FABA|nr:hypothetical protein [Stylosanthes scabra]